MARCGMFAKTLNIACNAHLPSGDCDVDQQVAKAWPESMADGNAAPLIGTPHRRPWPRGKLL